MTGGGDVWTVRMEAQSAQPGILSLHHRYAPARPIHWARLTDWSFHASSRGGGRDCRFLE